MQLTLLKTKLHRAHVTHSELEYEGSCAIDGKLLEISGIKEYEQIQLYNISNGERFTTYTIRAKYGSNIISVNGAAAHKASPGDQIIICAYSIMDEKEIAEFKPTLVYLDENNDIIRLDNSIPIQST